MAQMFWFGIIEISNAKMPGRLCPFSLNQFFIFLMKGVNAPEVWIWGYFLIPGLKPWATENVNPKPKCLGMEFVKPKPKNLWDRNL